MGRLVDSRWAFGVAAGVAVGVAGCGEAPRGTPAPADVPTSAAPAEPLPPPPTVAPASPSRYPSVPAPTGPEALADARRRGSPLLVLFAPDDEAARADRSRVLDLFLQRDFAGARAPLVLAHVVALGAADLETLAAGASATAPFAVLVETDGGGAATQVLPWPAALGGPDGLVSFDVQRLEHARDAPAADRAFWDLAHALDRALVGDDATAARRAAQRAAAGAADPALIGPDAAGTRVRRSEALSDAWREAPIPGTRWVPVPRVELSDGARRSDWCGTSHRDPRDGSWPELEDRVVVPDDGGPIRVRLEPLPPMPRFGGERPAPRPPRTAPEVVDAEGPARVEFLPPRR